MAALEPDGGRWVDLEIARRRAIAARAELAHDAVLFRQPVTTLDDHLARGLRVEALRDLVEGFTPRENDDDAVMRSGDLVFGAPILRPASIRDGYGFEGHVRTMWERRGGTVPPVWYELPVFYFSNTSEVRGPDDPVWAPRESEELDFELEVAALIDTPVMDVPVERAEEAIGGYLVFNDWSARDLQREETQMRLGPAKGKDFASSFGPWLVTPDELEDRRSGRGFDLLMTAHVNGEEISRGRWSHVPRPTSTSGPATSSAPGPSGPVASSRSATRRSDGTFSPATWSRSRSNGSECFARPSSLDPTEVRARAKIEAPTRSGRAALSARDRHTPVRGALGGRSASHDPRRTVLMARFIPSRAQAEHIVRPHG
jgi:2-keto-4-pentenoate hydratase/2-oxohepta-3-ene-1,7-dioic acid hydratase in catechol pathway